jgi:atypical dual specificity phosphatase
MYSPPLNFSWIEKPLLGASGRPDSRDELEWLRQEGIDVLVSLTEDSPRRDWINAAGLMLVHLPVEDMRAPSEDQLSQALNTVARANERQMGVGIHCAAGLGRTGVVVACYFVMRGATGPEAINRLRELRPGSIETEEQVDAVLSFARRAKF